MSGGLPRTAVAYGGSGDRNDHERPDTLQVLVEHPDLLRVLRVAITDPGQFVPRGEYRTGHPESITSWSARAVLELLRKVSAGMPPGVPDPDERRTS